MNKRQIRTLWMATILIVLQLLFPPYVQKTIVQGTVIEYKVKYAFLFDTIESYDGTKDLDTCRLMLGCLIVILLAGVRIVSLAERH